MTNPMQISEWATSFETADSRRHKHLSWVALPINLQGRGYQSLLDDFGDDAAAMYGTWIALVAFAAGCPNRGLLADSLGNAIPLTRISRVTGLPVEHFERLINWATSDKIRWLIFSQKTAEKEGSNAQTVANQPATSQQPVDDRTTNPTNKTNKHSVVSTAEKIFNQIKSIDGIPKPKALTRDRLSKIKARLKSPGWETAFWLAIQKLPLVGDGWQPDIDWLIANDSNVFKILEGKYNWRSGSGESVDRSTDLPNLREVRA